MINPSIILAICALSVNILALPQSEIGPVPMMNPVGQDMLFKISFWKSSNCQGKTTTVKEVHFNETIRADTSGKPNTGDVPVASYKISADLGYAAILEFSNDEGSNLCAKKLEITNPDSNNNPLKRDVCYNFSKGPTAQCFIYYQADDRVTTPKPKSATPPQIRKRYEDTGIKLHTWEQLKCPGDPTESHELLKDEKKPFNKEIRAYKVSHPFTSNQMLDFSNTDTLVDPNNKCGRFLEQTNPMKSPIENSWVLLPGICYPFTGHLSAQCVEFHY